MADADPAAAKKPRPMRRRPPDSIDPIEIAMAAAGGSEVAHDLLEKQARLVEADLVYRRWQIVTERAAAAFRTLLALAALILIAGLGAMIWEARNSRGIVVESFNVPPALAAQGLGGEVLAGKLLDRLADMRARSTSSRAVDALESGWRDEYRVAIPQTGLSVGEVRTALRRWLGDDIRIGGDVYRTAGGLALTVRTNRAASATFAGAEGELDRLAAAAAEDVFRKISPHQYASFLNADGRSGEAIRIWLEVARTNADRRERAWALNALGTVYNDQGRCAEAALLLERGIRLEPDLPNLSGNLAVSRSCLGQEQLAADLSRRTVALSRSGRAVDQDPARRIAWIRRSEASLAEAFGDFRRELRLAAEMELAGESAWAVRAAALAGRSEVRASMRALAEARPADAFERAQYWSLRYQQAEAVRDWPAAASFLGRARAACAAAGTTCFAQWPMLGQPWHAAATARAGEAEAAAAMVRGLPGDCYYCAWGRAAVAEAAGDRAAADRWFADAVRLGPRLPFALVEWGKAGLARGDPAAALAHFERALDLAPEHLHAHKGRGDALARLGRRREAIQSYQAAADRAPRWGALHVDWGIALWQAGRRDRARDKWRAAAAMDLSRRDRARLRHIWGIANRSAP